MILRVLSRRGLALIANAIKKHCARSIKSTLPVLFLYLSLPLAIPANYLGAARHGFGILLIIVITWLIAKFIYVIEEVLLSRVPLDVEDNLQARKIHTQLKIVRQVVVAIIIILAVASILISFDSLRQLGKGLLASAGIAGLVVGLAAQKAIAGMIAGFQIAITQPIRIDDVVIVEDEWGRIEEITLTYVVVRIWDQRRLVLPISYFLEKPFQNWTRKASELLGTISIYVDYTAPVAAIRQELDRIVQASPHWDQRVCKLDVTNASERTIELRALISAADSGAAWELRCQVREQLIDFLQKNYPATLPKIRAEMQATNQTG